MSLDSRLARPVGIRPLVRRFGAIVQGEPVFCLSCGSRDGYVPTELPPGVFYLCGRCETIFGVPEEMLPRPDIERMT